MQGKDKQTSEMKAQGNQCCRLTNGRSCHNSYIASNSSSSAELCLLNEGPSFGPSQLSHAQSQNSFTYYSVCLTPHNTGRCSYNLVSLFFLSLPKKGQLFPCCFQKCNLDMRAGKLGNFHILPNGWTKKPGAGAPWATYSHMAIGHKVNFMQDTASLGEIALTWLHWVCVSQGLFGLILATGKLKLVVVCCGKSCLSRKTFLWQRALKHLSLMFLLLSLVW